MFGELTVAHRYPVMYTITVMPLSVVRFIQFGQERHGRQSHIPPGATFGVESLWNLNGVVDVVLFFLTRQGLLLF